MVTNTKTLQFIQLGQVDSTKLAFIWENQDTNEIIYWECEWVCGKVVLTESPAEVDYRGIECGINIALRNS
jgi:hypothetical protein